jgi:hypothetical protein
MRFLGLVLAGALALTATTAVQAGSLGPGWYPMPNGWDGDWRRAPSPTRQSNGGPVSPRSCPNCPGGWACCSGTGVPTYWVWVPAAELLTIHSQTGEARPVAGVIRRRLVLSSSASGFSPPMISHTAV